MSLTSKDRVTRFSRVALVWQSVFPESRMISKILPENGFPRQCAHWLGMTLYLRFVYNLRAA